MNYHKNMKIGLLIAILSVSACNADAEDVPKPKFPYMGFIYYPHEVNESGSDDMFMNAAVLVEDDWLLSGTIDPEAGFGNRTLMARVGAAKIDANFTIGDDEQEREVIAIIRPKEENPEEYWRTDVTLLKTESPFANTSFVSPTKIPVNRDFADKTCSILIYAQRDGKGDERDLIQMNIELLTPTPKTCGKHYNENTMTCGVEDDNITNTISQNFCQDNTGGPLICDKELMGLQTYPDSENHCKSPYVYQIICAWKNFINCGKRACADECSKVCSIQYRRANDSLLVDPKDTELLKTVEMIDVYENAEALSDTVVESRIIQDTEANTAMTDSPKEDAPQSTDKITEVTSSQPESTEIEARQAAKGGNETNVTTTPSPLPKRKLMPRRNSNKVAKTDILNYLLLGTVLDLTFVVLF